MIENIDYKLFYFSLKNCPLTLFLFDPPNDGGDDNKEDDDDYYPEPPEGASSKWFSRVKLAIRFIVFPNFVHLLLVVITVVNMVGNSIQIVTGLG